ncbi:probable RNA polymerase II nuclear localization protein SLC7A6OS isoform X1 [Anastrepha obliqua]|uniref:probable RNA polymerase II nuclear localization protein SLC7A6OS isoform X1 n=1 Tax=Anastrepha obliqua TaxID=95512 RepID=UPI002409654C|nr:probable RNA polymerase II nuclear localization protein SLC7A6OS isoform X1 [Anastrepha obliqua]
MPAVVRIKRRVDEEPLSAFIINSKKRRRLDNVSEEDAQGEEAGAAGVDIGAVSDSVINDKDGETSTVLKFAGTLQEQDDGATTQLARLTKEAAKELVQQKSLRTPRNHTERARQEMRQALHENRFRVVNCMRTTLEDTDTSELAAKEVTIVDIEKQEADERVSSAVTTTATGHLNTLQEQSETKTMEAQYSQTHGGNNTQQSTDCDTGYVYDLYLPENELQVEYADMMDDNYLSIRPYDDLVYEDRFNDDDDEDDSEDSNNENYYTNEYPDEDEDNEDYVDSHDHEDIDQIAMNLGRMRTEYIEDGIRLPPWLDADSSDYESEDSSEMYSDDFYGARDETTDEDIDRFSIINADGESDNSDA